MSKLAGKTALITGGGQGVGQGIAWSLASAGAQVAVCGRTMQSLETTCDEIHKRGGKALAIQCDVNKLADLSACVEQVVAHFGGLQILVNNAQQVPLGSLAQVSDESFQDGFSSGPLATHRLMKLCYAHLKGDGCIVNLASSVAMRWDASNYGVYAACKEAIRALTRAAACEWAKDGIRTNVILPHAASPGLRWWIDNNPQQAQEFIDSIPMQRIGDCEQDIGEFVATLCSDACQYINGQSIGVDGGQANLG